MIPPSRHGMSYAIRSVQRPEALVPLVFSIIALTLSLLCVLAGTKRGYYENVHILTVGGYPHPDLWDAVNLLGQYIYDRACECPSQPFDE
jgi:hypothetical protein